MLLAAVSGAAIAAGGGDGAALTGFAHCIDGGLVLGPQASFKGLKFDAGGVWCGVV